MRSYTRALLLAALGLSIAACGGGGGGSDAPPQNTAPVASFTATPADGSGPLTVQLNASASTDPGGSITTYSWNFGDNSAAGSGVTTSHIFQTNGTYTVTLTVTDNSGTTGSTTRQVSVNALVGGWWGGTTSIVGQGTFELIGLVAEDGRGYFFQEDGILYWGTVRASGNQITSTLTGAGLFGTTFSDGSARGTGSVSGAIQARSSISANSSFTSAGGTTATSTISLLYDPLYDNDSSLAMIAGNYADLIGIYDGVLNIASNGTLFHQDPTSGCVINGRIAIINAAYNAYDVQFTYSSCTGPEAIFNGVTFSGLVAYDPSGAILALVHGTVGGIPYPNVFIFGRI
jgi:PKD repeat protein